MSWRLEFRPEVEDGVAHAADWYEAREPGLGSEFVEEIIRTWDTIAAQPLIGSRRHPSLGIRWRYPERFPYRVIDCADETANPPCFFAILCDLGGFAVTSSQWETPRTRLTASLTSKAAPAILVP